MLQTALVVVFSWLVTQLIVRAIDGDPLASLMPLLGALVLVVAVRFAVGWGADINAARGAARVKSQLRARVTDAVTALGPAWLRGRNSTAVGVTAGPGLDALDTYFAKYLPQLVLTAIATPALVLVIWWQDWISGVIVALTLPLIPVFMILIGWATQTVQRRQWQQLSRLSTAFGEVVSGLATLKIFGRQGRQAGRIRAVTEGYRRQTMKVLRVSFLSGFALELAASLSVALVAVSIGVRLIDGSLGLAVGLFVLLLAPEAFLPVRNVGVQFHAAADGVAASEEVFAILDAEADAAAAIAVAERAADRAIATTARGGATGGPGGPGSTAPDGLEVRDGRDGIVLDGVGVRYGDVVAVGAVSARFARGRVTAVTGASGSGKSSLVAALVGFVDHSGAIRVDGRRVPARGALPRDWVAWAGQRSTLVAGDVLGNVALGDPAPDAAAARSALDLAGAPGIALDAPVDARGGGFSGGQAQRIATARAAYRARRLDCALAVFDEPSSALDLETEQSLIRCLRVLADEGHAVVVVTHRPAVIAAADDQLHLAAREAEVLR